MTKAVREQNFQVASGHIGQQSKDNGVSFDYTITTEGRLTTPEQFDEIVIRTDAEGRKIRIKDVGRAKLGAAQPRLHEQGQRPAQRQPRRLGVAGRQLHRRGQARRGQDGPTQEELPRGHRLRHLPRHDAVHGGVDPRGQADAGRGRHPGRHRRAGLPPELAVGPHPARWRCPSRSSARSR